MTYRPHPSAFDARRIIAWGLAWSLALTVAEASIASRIDATDWATLLNWVLLQWMLPLWWLHGCALLWSAQRAERVAGNTGMVSALVVVSLLDAAVHPVLGWMVGPARHLMIEGHMNNMSALMPSRDLYAWLSLATYQFWIGMSYGGLLVLAFALVTRRERMQHLLHLSAIARSRAEALLGAERLESQRSQIDPQLLLAVIHDMDVRYRCDAPHGDRLLTALVEFLRCAMPGLRERHSTLDTELRLARAYFGLQSERGVCVGWCIETPLAPQPLSIPFPSLLMLPLLALGDARQPMRIEVDPVADTIRMTVSGVSQVPDAGLEARIRHCLTAEASDVIVVVSTSQGERHEFRRNG